MSDGFATFIRCRHPETDMQTSRLPLWDIIIRIKKNIGDTDIRKPTRSKIESIHQAQWKSDGMYKTVMQTSEMQTKLAKLQVPEIFSSLKLFDNFFSKIDYLWDIFIRIKKESEMQTSAHRLGQKSNPSTRPNGRATECIKQ